MDKDWASDLSRFQRQSDAQSQAQSRFLISIPVQVITRRQVVDCGTFPGQSVRGGIHADHRGVPPQIVSHTE